MQYFGTPLPEGCTFIAPSLSVGNVGQLALDLIINTLDLPRVGYLDDPTVLAACGPDAFTGAGDAPSGSMEVYLYGTQNVVLVQVRAPTQNRDVLARNLLEWLNGVKAAKLLLACSSDSSSRHDNQMQ